MYTIKEVVINFTDAPPHRVTLTLHTRASCIISSSPLRQKTIHPGPKRRRQCTSRAALSPVHVRARACVCVRWPLLLAPKWMLISRFIHYKARAPRPHTSSAKYDTHTHIRAGHLCAARVRCGLFCWVLVLVLTHDSRRRSGSVIRDVARSVRRDNGRAFFIRIVVVVVVLVRHIGGAVFGFASGWVGCSGVPSLYQQLSPARRTTVTTTNCRHIQTDTMLASIYVCRRPPNPGDCDSGCRSSPMCNM